MMKQSLRTFGLVALVFAVTSWLAEMAFYGGVDGDGVLQESFFLPFAFILGVTGLIFLVASFAMKSKD